MQVFRELDLDQDGLLTNEELATAIQGFGMNLTQREVTFADFV